MKETSEARNANVSDELVIQQYVTTETICGEKGASEMSVKK